MSLIAGGTAFVLGVGLPAHSVGAASSTGTLIVEIVAGVQDAYEHDKGRTVWVYLSGDDTLNGTKQLFGKSRITDQSHKGGDVVSRVQGDVLAGRYRFILVGAASPEIRSYGRWAGGVVANRICEAVADVKPGTVTRVRLGPDQHCWVDFGLSHNWDMGYHPLRGGNALSSATATLLRYQTAVEETKSDCDKRAAPLFDLYERLKAAPPRRPLIVLPEMPLANNLEVDAEQIRYVVEYLSSVCWYNDFPKDLSKFRLNPQERQMAEILNETVLRERFKINRLNGIAEILEAVERREKR